MTRLLARQPPRTNNPGIKALRRTLSLAACVPGCALLGAMAAADNRFSSWGGALIGGSLGMFFGLAFGGALPRSVADYCFEPKDDSTEK